MTPITSFSVFLSSTARVPPTLMFSSHYWTNKTDRFIFKQTCMQVEAMLFERFPHLFFKKLHPRERFHGGEFAGRRILRGSRMQSGLWPSILRLSLLQTSWLGSWSETFLRQSRDGGKFPSTAKLEKHPPQSLSVDGNQRLQRDEKSP